MSVFFYKSNENILQSKKENKDSTSEQEEIKKIQESFLKVLDNKNLSFLLGSGCSSYEILDDIIKTETNKDLEETSESDGNLEDAKNDLPNDKLMNLKNLNVQELTSKELKTKEGGFFGPFRAGLTLAYRQMWGVTGGSFKDNYPPGYFNT